MGDPTIVAGWIGVAGTLVGSALGAYFGARFAFTMATRAKDREEADKRVAAANRALFILGQQLNLMANLRKQSLDLFREDGARHINMQPMQTMDYSHWRIEIASLDFLLATKFRDSHAVAARR